jgi:formylglycine-generating enzyme required for sulfatase activity
MPNDLETILIPAGPFLMGEDLRPIFLPDFRIAKYPVTNEHYFRFVKATNHRPPDHWLRDGTYPSGLTHHPVVFVSWEDATAYAEWTGARLPTEAEWEKAARGTDGRLYPWGNEFIPENCNSSESKSSSTCSVETHPGGVSPYGVMDMAGNTWEWTSSLYEEGQEWRVLKGGAWDYKGIKDTRCAHRVYFSTNFRNSAVGFRCCWD